jgi:hypothetical protein
MTIHRDEFRLEGKPREVRDEAVSQLDQALAGAAGGRLEQVLHAIDPRRILRFEAGGPPVWSVALCPCPDRTFLFVTYGLSRYIDPDARFDHELSIRVAAERGGEPPAWPTFLLRQLARYQVGSGRELRVGDPMTFAESITRAAMAPEHQASMPDSPMRTIGVAADPGMHSVRRVYGLLADEQALAETWSIAGLLGEIARRDPTLTTTLGRPSWAGRADVVRAVSDGAAREGSATGAIVVPGLRWERTARGVAIHIPGGPVVRRIAALIRGRLGFGRTLLLHDYEPAPYSEVGLGPGEPGLHVDDDRMVEVSLGVDSPILFGLYAAAREERPSPVTIHLH